MYAVSLMRVSLEQPLPMFQNLWLRRLEMPLTSKVEELLSVTLVAILLDCLLQIFPWNRSICHTRLRPSHPPKRTPGNQLYCPCDMRCFNNSVAACGAVDHEPCFRLFLEPCHCFEPFFSSCRPLPPFSLLFNCLPFSCLPDIGNDTFSSPSPQ